MKKKLNFIIAEFDHYEPIYALLKCIAPHASAICVFTLPQFIVRLQQEEFGNDHPIVWHEVEGPAHIKKQDIEAFQKKIDVFIMATSTDFDEARDLLAEIKPAKTLMWIRNINFWFEMSKRYKVFKRPRSEFHEKILSLAEKADAFVVESPNLKMYLQKMINGKSPVMIFPYSIFEKVNSKTADTDKIVVSIPGYIQRSRRDYDIALDAFERLDKKKFKLKLLGQARDEYGYKIIDRANGMISKGYCIDFLKKPEDFEQEMIDSDILFAPINVETNYSGVNETYGLSKESGLTFDVIRYAKPAIFPSEMGLPEELNDSVFKYSNIDELLVIFDKFTQNEYFDQIVSKAIAASKKYSKEEITKKFLAAIDEI
ncbi:MAG: hypothetical protein JST82_17025 [Bacteroidetes bacterium]|nr:hypothetical protein [Bacteroidota bacterium]